MMAVKRFEVGDSGFLLDGKPLHIRCGEIHLARVPRPYWRDRLKKAKAMGLNTVCAYLFWNAHEPTRDVFDFSDNLDARAFVKMAAEEGLHVLLRPGPYVCAEWDFGGLPAWLLAAPDIRVRCMDERFTAPAARYLKAVGEQLADLCVTRGGPVLMVQVENEYGAYGNDQNYMAFVRDAIKAAGFDVPLFTCDWPDEAINRAGSLPDCYGVANFGSDAPKKIAAFRKLRSAGPMMCGEFWCGWFDQWGKPRNGSGSIDSATDIRWMCDNNVSFSVYMFHGGTSFGFTAGANQYDDFASTVTSYDYHACLDEAGRPTEKFHAYRKAMLGDDAPPAELPTPLPTITIPPFVPTESAALFDHLPASTHGPAPLPMEMLGQTQGMVLYRTTLSRGMPTDLSVEQLHDYAHVYIDGVRVATLDRMKKQSTARLPPIERDGTRLEILVDALGRVNFGPQMIDRKGITERVTLGHFTLFNWEMFSLPQNASVVSSLLFTGSQKQEPAFYRSTVGLQEIGDTFLDMSRWGKGNVWINGNNLGRYWSIGPQQTLFVPGCWLKVGANEIVVFDIEGLGPQPLAGLAEPVLDVTPLYDRAAHALTPGITGPT